MLNIFPSGPIVLLQREQVMSQGAAHIFGERLWLGKGSGGDGVRTDHCQCSKRRALRMREGRASRYQTVLLDHRWPEQLVLLFIQTPSACVQIIVRRLRPGPVIVTDRFVAVSNHRSAYIFRRSLLIGYWLSSFLFFS